MAGKVTNERVVLRNTMLFPRQFHEDAMGLEPLDRLAFYDALLGFAFYDRETRFEDAKLDALYRYAVSRMRPSLAKFDAKCAGNRRSADELTEDEVRRLAEMENLRGMDRQRRDDR